MDDMTRQRRPDPPTAVVPVRPIVTWLTACWAVALVAVLLVPDWRHGDRSWWPWSAASGLALGVAWLAAVQAADHAVRTADPADPS